MYLVGFVSSSDFKIGITFASFNLEEYVSRTTDSHVPNLTDALSAPEERSLNQCGWAG